MTSWLKLGYFADVEDDPAYWRAVDWVSDSPGRTSPRWRVRPVPTVRSLYPAYGPQYEIGDRLVMYLTVLGRCPAILEVTAEPRWDPDRVDAEAGLGEGDQWGVVTEVAFVTSTALSRAPHLEDLGVVPGSVARKGHIHLEDWQYREAERLIARRSRAGRSRRRSTSVPLEEGELEGYESRTLAATRAAVRREAKLVRDYAAYLRAKGDRVTRNKLEVDGAGPLYTDVFNVDRNQLIEAKADKGRGAIRMAIGQLADYRRFVKPPPAIAVLLEAKPHPDLLHLLDSQGIAVIWREGEIFTDTAADAFV